MKLSAQITLYFNLCGIEIGGNSILREGDMGIEPVQTTLPAGVAAATWTKTDGDTAAATLNEGHGLSSGTYAVFWAEGIRYGVTATIADNDVTLEGGGGDDFPDSDTAAVISRELTIPSEFDGDDVTVIAAKSTKRTHLRFIDSDSALVGAQLELSANVPWGWFTAFGAVNPLTGNAVASIRVACGEADDAVLHIAGLQNAIA